MKTKVFLIITAIITFAFLSCDKEENEKSNISGFISSDCKDDLRKGEIIESISLKTLSNNKLQVKHTNSEFNCCPGKLFTECSINENIITINEDETKSECDCMCPYDLDYTIANLESKIYTVKLKKSDKIHIEFQLNFTANTDTSFVIKNSN